MQEASEDELGSETQHTNDVQPLSQFCDGLLPPPNKKQKTSKHTISLSDVNKSAFEYFQSKKNVGSNISEKKIQDPDESFLMSVLPDMKEMNSEQKRRFKIGILKMAGDILSEFSYRPTPEPFSNSTSTPSSIINNDLLRNSSSESPSSFNQINYTSPPSVIQTFEPPVFHQASNTYSSTSSNIH